jgi:hypothetical protein
LIAARSKSESASGRISARVSDRRRDHAHVALISPEVAGAERASPRFRGANLAGSESAMEWKLGKIRDTIIGPRWRVRHHARGAATAVFDIVGGKDEAEAIARVKAAYARERGIISVERLDDDEGGVK